MAGELAVVVVTHRSATVIEDCLRATVKAISNIPHARVIVVDRGSDDETLAVVARTAPEAESVECPADAGFAAGVNAGIAAATGRDVLVLHPEVRLDPESVTHLRAALAAPGTGIAIPRLVDANGREQRLSRRRRTLGPAWLVSRECLDATGPLHEETAYPRRCRDRGFAVRSEPAALATHLAGGPGYVCFSAQDWWYHNRAHSDTQLMRGVAASRKVLLVNSIGLRMPSPGRSSQVASRILRKLGSVARFVRRPLPNFYVMSPLPLPFYSSPLLRRVSAVLVRTQVRMVCALLRIDRPVIVVTLPTAWDVVRPMRRHSLIYNRSDLHSAFAEAHRPTIEALEAELLEHADHVVYASRALLADERARTADRAYFLDHGVDVDHFVRQAISADLQAIPSPRIGFFGGLDDRVVDFDLLERIAVELPHASLVLIGNATHPMERFDKYPNVYWLGFRPYESIPAYGSGFDVAIMPWQNNRWIHYANPIKLKEYLALGLPVVSTTFAELAHYTDRIRAAHSHAEFIAAIHESLRTGPLRSPTALRASVLPRTWRSQTAKLMTLAEPRRP